jgi:GT2 family glycosyltransferase
MLYPDPIVIGCNVAARRTVFSSIGHFDVGLGPGTGAVAEDLDFVYRAFRSGFKVVALPSMVVYHAHGRRSDEETARAYRGYLVGRGAFYLKYILQRDYAVAGMAAEDIVTSLSCVCRVRGVRGELRFLRALGAGAIYQLRRVANPRTADDGRRDLR